LLMECVDLESVALVGFRSCLVNGLERN